MTLRSLSAKLVDLRGDFPEFFTQLERLGDQEDQALFEPSIWKSCPIEYSDQIDREVEVLYLYGWELALHFFHTFLLNDPGRRLVLIEDRLSVILKMLAQQECRSLLSDYRVRSITTTIDQGQDLLDQEVMAYIHKKSLFYLPNFFKRDSEPYMKAIQWQKRFDVSRHRAKLTLAYVADFGVKELGQVSTNLRTRTTFKRVDDLVNAFEGQAAIVIGAGPSLETHLDLLPLCDQKGLLIGAGSALHLLAKVGIEPHFGVAVDPNPPKEIWKGLCWPQLPLFYQNQFAPDLLMLWQERLCVGKEEVFHFERHLTCQHDRVTPLLSPVDVGWTSGTCGVAMAALMGCSPIVILGIEADVAGNRDYAFDEQLDGQHVTSCLERSYLDREASRVWLEEFIDKNQGDREVIDLSQIDPPLVAKYMNQLPACDLDGLVHQKLICLDRWGMSVEEIDCRIDAFYASVALCNKLLERSFALLTQGSACRRGSSRLVDLFSEIDVLDKQIAETLFYRSVLEPLWQVWSAILQSKEMVEGMAYQAVERRIQRGLFFQTVTRSYLERRDG